MDGKYPKTSPESGTGGGVGVVGLLKELSRDDVLEALSHGFCQHCEALLEKRIHGILNKRKSSTYCSYTLENGSESITNLPHQQPISPTTPVSSKQPVANSDILLNDGLGGTPTPTPATDNGLSEEQKEQIRIWQVERKADFVHNERVHGKTTNVLKGLELHTKVFNTEEQKKIVECVYNLQRMGQKGQLRERTYSEPRKWMRGKGRVTIQFGCCYNYAVDKKGNPPGIIRDEEVDPLPPLFKQMIKRMVRWHILPPTCIPNSCVVNIYDEGDCIPPHIDHHDFVRPFSTVSLLTECNIIFGSSLKILTPGEFSGPVSIPLPVGSVFIINGNGADIAKHCVPGVSGKRISITFRRMDDSKVPYNFSPDPELLGIKPLTLSPPTRSALQGQSHHQRPVIQSSFVKTVVRQNLYQNDQRAKGKPEEIDHESFLNQSDDFPPLGRSSKVRVRS